ncbi:MAG: hypothetical protein HW374_1987, partial [Bacteroidetes bacterium]|nr:hypothetical protein [Bacteroidota bacterium]
YKPVGGITVDATFNPDFGQVEADPAVLNLSTFETFYPEKRPFFVEGSQIVRFTTFGGNFGPGLFYSRRIGRALPGVGAPSGWYVLNEPRFATIIGAAKVSGKTAGGLSIGVLEAMTKEEVATLVDSNGVKTDVIAEPFSNYSLFRVKQDVFANSNVGTILTSVNKKGRLPAFTGGLDWNLKFFDNEYRADGFWAGSHTTNSSGQRISGGAGRATFAKAAGKHWRGSVTVDYTSKEFNINDVGFFRRPNDYGFVANASYKDDVPEDWRQFWIVDATYHYRKNFDGAELFNSLSNAGNLTFTNYWQMGYQVSKDWGLHDDRETRGNGLYYRPERQSFLFLTKTDPRSSVVAELIGISGYDGKKGRSSSVIAELELKPAAHITVELSASRSTADQELAWVSNLYNLPVSPNLISVFGDRSTEAWDIG